MKTSDNFSPRGASAQTKSYLPESAGSEHPPRLAAWRVLKFRARLTFSENPELLYEFGPFRVDPSKETLLKAGVAVPLTPKTFQILLVLVRHGRRIVTKDDLMKSVWPDTFVEEANLSRNIFMLRKAMGERLGTGSPLHCHHPRAQLPSHRKCPAGTRRSSSRSPPRATPGWKSK